jgi:hypothetical protein
MCKKCPASFAGHFLLKNQDIIPGELFRSVFVE